MEQYAKKEINGYLIVIFLNNNNDKLNIFLQNKGKNGEKFINTQLKFKESFEEYFSNFEDLLQQINEERGIIIGLTEIYSNSEKKNNKIFRIKNNETIRE